MAHSVGHLCVVHDAEDKTPEELLTNTAAHASGSDVQLRAGAADPTAEARVRLLARSLRQISPGTKRLWQALCSGAAACSEVAPSCAFQCHLRVEQLLHYSTTLFTSASATTLTATVHAWE